MPAGVAGEPAGAVSQAVERMTDAESALREGDVGTAAGALEDAATSLAMAEAQVAGPMLGSPMGPMSGQGPSAPASQGQPGHPGQAGQQPDSQPGQGQAAGVSAAQGGGGGGGGSVKESERGLDEAPGEVPEGENWDGAVSDLDKGDRQRAGNRYSPYYRRAMQQYMQDLQKEQQEE
jgi:hypothetical protein